MRGPHSWQLTTRDVLSRLMFALAILAVSLKTCFPAEEKENSKQEDLAQADRDQLGYFGLATIGLPLFSALYLRFKYSDKARPAWSRRLREVGFGFYY